MYTPCGPINTTVHSCGEGAHRSLVRILFGLSSQFPKVQLTALQVCSCELEAVGRQTIAIFAADTGTVATAVVRTMSAWPSSSDDASKTGVCEYRIWWEGGGIPLLWTLRGVFGHQGQQEHPLTPWPFSPCEPNVSVSGITFEGPKNFESIYIASEVHLPGVPGQVPARFEYDVVPNRGQGGCGWFCLPRIAGHLFTLLRGRCASMSSYCS